MSFLPQSPDSFYCMSYFRPNIAAMTPYVPGEQPRGEKVIKLNTNENPYPCSPKVKTAIGRVVQAGLQKYPDPLATAFRIAAGGLYGVDPDWILCGNGSDELLTMITRALVDSGDVVRFANPGYILYRTLAEIQGARADVVNFNADWSLGDEFARPINRLKLAFLANPNSPSGTLVPPRRVAELAAALPCPLVVDEAYVDFADTNCMALVRENEKILVLRTLSKSYALAGLRFGFLVAQPQMIEHIRKVKDSYNCDALSIAGATAAIDDQAWLNETRATILATRERMTDALRKLGFASVPSQANFVWNPHPSVPVEPLYQQLKASGVLVRYMNYAPWGDGLRISVGTDEQVDACLTLLKSII
jgi:histidinol-phosphate aminotransferase